MSNKNAVGAVNDKVVWGVWVCCPYESDDLVALYETQKRAEQEASRLAERHLGGIAANERKDWRRGVRTRMGDDVIVRSHGLFS